jgi:hypothetical protein
VVIALSEKVEIEVEGSLQQLERLDAVIHEDDGAICLMSGVIACLVMF